MRSHATKVAAVLAVAFLANGCASDPFKQIPPRQVSPAVELEHAPFFPQRAYQCGPAALATVLVESGVAVGADDLVPRIYIPRRRGSLQPEILAASREYGRIPYVIAPSFAALVAELSEGRPVLVLQNLGISAIPKWHYAVVVGYSRARGEVILRSGTDKRRITSAGLFMRTWKRSGYWGMVALRPGELPQTVDRKAYLRAVAEAESMGQFSLSDPSYAAAARRWPDHSLPWIGLGNSAYVRGEARRAERMYRRALLAEPQNAVALNNLATVLTERGSCAEASRLLHRALALPDLTRAMAQTLASSQAETRFDLDHCK